MKVSKQASREAKKLFRGCFAGGRLDENRMRETIRQVASAKPRGYLAILEHLRRLVKLEVDRNTARVESAQPLPAEFQADVTGRLTRLYGPGLDISFAPNAALLGGLRIKVGSDVYDGSIQGRLKALAEKF
jgi:F-type H+-transporting ATPase subunit delta